MKANFLSSKYFPFILVIAFILTLAFLINRNNPNASPAPEAAPISDPISNKTEVQKQNYVEIKGVKVSVELAVDAASQSKGLSGRAGLSKNQGMVFVFPNPSKYGFWMKDMNFPIDMIWFGENWKVVYIKKNATPESYPEIFKPGQDAKYVLEVPAGFSDAHYLRVGDQAKFFSK